MLGPSHTVAVLLALGLGGSAASCQSAPDAAPPPPRRPAATFATTIEAPPTLGVVDTALTDVHGSTIGVACATCHASAAGPRAALSKRPGAPPVFHTTIALQHGSLGCPSCHHPENRTLLRLADGTPLPIADAMRLCAQCHGAQQRDYQHGAHGGMLGHWDLSQGPRTRNSCVACHPPHAPRYPKVIPARGPADRFLTAKPATRSAIEERFDTAPEETRTHGN